MEASVATALKEEYTEVKKITDDPVALLSLPSVRKLVLGHVLLSGCRKFQCDCRTAPLVTQLESAVERVRAAANVEQCKDSWTDVSSFL